MPSTKDPRSLRREAQAKYSERRATRTERAVPLELPVQAQEQSQCSSDEQEPEPISSGKVQPTRYYDWEGQELDVKITDKAITFEGKRYVGNKMNIAMDLIIERGKKPSARRRRVDPYARPCLTDVEVAALEKKKRAAAKSATKAKAHRDDVARRAAEATRTKEQANKGGIMNWVRRH